MSHLTDPPFDPSARPRPRPESATAWQLLRDDAFERITDDVELRRLVAEHALRTSEPHAEILRGMLGMSLSEDDARAMFARVLDHRREMERALGRPVHVRVAALDMLMARPSSTGVVAESVEPAGGTSSTAKRRESRPIIVAAELLERALEEAGSDSVTGLPRGSHFFNLLQHELLQRSRRVVVAYLDLDGFKLVNDEHGHARGDQVLRTMAEAARSVLRRGDVLARIGGDEFGLMLVDVGLEEASAVIERLRARFEELTNTVSFSAGAIVAGAGATAEELLAEADRAMYAQKRDRKRDPKRDRSKE